MVFIIMDVRITLKATTSIWVGVFELVDLVLIYVGTYQVMCNIWLNYAIFLA